MNNSNKHGSHRNRNQKAEVAALAILVKDRGQRPWAPSADRGARAEPATWVSRRALSLIIKRSSLWMKESRVMTAMESSIFKIMNRHKEWRPLIEMREMLCNQGWIILTLSETNIELTRMDHNWLNRHDLWIEHLGSAEITLMAIKVMKAIAQWFWKMLRCWKVKYMLVISIREIVRRLRML